MSRAKDANPSPVPSTGFLPLSTVLACSRRVHTPRMYLRKVRRLPWLPDASRPCSMPLASLERPKELSLPGEPCPLSRASASLRVRTRPPPARLWTSFSRSLSPTRQLFAERFRTRRDARRRSRDDGSPRSLGQPVDALARTLSVHQLVQAGLAGKWPARPLRSFAPPGSPFTQRPRTLARARSSGRCSPGLLSLLERAPALTPGPVSRSGARGPGRARTTCVPGSPATPSRKRDPGHDAWVLAPRIRRHTQSIELRAPPSGGDSAVSRVRDTSDRTSPAPCQQSWPPALRSLGRTSGAVRPRPLSAAPRASHVLGVRRPRPFRDGRAPHAGPRRRWSRVVLVDRSLDEADHLLQGFVPRRTSSRARARRSAGLSDPSKPT